MKNKLKYIFIGLGLLFIILGLSLLLITGESKDNNSKENNIEISISQSDMIGDKIDNSNKSNYEIKSDYKETYIKSNDLLQKNQYTFYYPSELSETTLDDKNKHLYSENLSIETNFTNIKSIDDYKKEFISSYDNENTLLQIYESKEAISISGLDVYYLKFNYQEEILDISGNKNKVYKEKFAIFIQESDKYVVSIILTSTDKKLTNEFLTEFINKIKIEKEVAIYTYGTINDTVVQGAIKQKKWSGSQIYSIKYEISSNDYQEMPITQNNIYKTRFESRNIDCFVDIEIEVDEYSVFFTNFVEDLKPLYPNSKETDFEIKQTNYDGINYYKIDFEYYNSIDKVTKNALYLIREVDKGIYYIVSFTAKDDISEEMIKEFLNIKYEIEYPNQEIQG